MGFGEEEEGKKSMKMMACGRFGAAALWPPEIAWRAEERRTKKKKKKNEEADGGGRGSLVFKVEGRARLDY